MTTGLIYVGGYGRSGSTLLERLLTRSANVIGCGEVVRLTGSSRSHENKCTCGALPKNCAIWGPFLNTGLSHPQLTIALMKSTSDRYRIMVDSSKTAWFSMSAPFRLNGKLKDKFLLVHLVRDPRGVAWSGLWTGDDQPKSTKVRDLVRCMYTVVGWWAANLTCELFGIAYPRRYVRLRYEDLVQSYEVVVADLLERFGVVDPLLNPSDDTNRHQIYGNRMRYGSLATIKENLSWQAEMPPAFQRTVEILSYFLRRRYGYERVRDIVP
jgi:hypothetical protein